MCGFSIVISSSVVPFTPSQFCRKVWLGLYDSRSGTEPDSREEQKVRDFMVQKYERKRFYVAPTEAMKDNARQMNEASLNKQPTTKPLKSLLGENVPKLRVHSNQVSNTFQHNK